MKLYVDYTGKKLSYTDKATGEQIWVDVVVTKLPASQYIYMEAMLSQRQENFTNLNQYTQCQYSLELPKRAQIIKVIPKSQVKPKQVSISE